MKTTLNIDADLIDQALRLTGERTKTAVIELGLLELIKQAKRRRLADYLDALPGPIVPEPPRRKRFR